MKTKMILASLVFAATAAISTSAASARPFAPAWQFLGAREVALHADRDSIHVGGHQRFAQVKICVERRAVRFRDVDVRFDNHGRQDLSVRRLIGPGECTRALDLNGHRRDIKRITMLYDTLGFGRRAVVKVYAR
jgi:hypothetical protein